MDLEARLARLESSNRRLRSVVRVLGLLLAAVFAVGAAPQVADVVQTRSLQVVDASGRPIVVLGDDSGHGYAAFFDAQGRAKAHIGAAAVGGSLALKGAGGSNLVVLGPGEKGDGALLTYTAGGHEHVKLGTTHDGAGAVTTFRKDGQRLIQVTGDTKGNGLIAVFTPDGRVRASWP